MPKLFTALGVPQQTAEQLTAIQPPPGPGIRLVEPGQMHVTLHYLGEVDVAKTQRITDVLAAVDVPAFRLTLAGVGSFPPSKGAVTLWAGVPFSAELQSLHAAIARALTAEGFVPEVRPYTPHLTLARCEESVAASVASEFLHGPGGSFQATIAVGEFGFYSTDWIDERPHYRLERSFALQT